MRDLVAARRYAQALFSQSREADQVSACLHGLQAFVRAADAEPMLQRVLGHPFIASDRKRALVRSVLEEHATPLLERFFQMLIDKRRIGLAAAIAEEFQARVDAMRNVQAWQVRTAFPLSDAQQSALKAQLERWSKAEVRLEVRVDPSLIGGLIVRSHDRILDQSLRGQLIRLEQQLSV